MAEGSTSVGSIQLEIDISKESLGKGISNLEKAFEDIDLAGGFKDTLAQFSKELSSFIKNDIANLTSSIKETMSALEELKKPVEVDVASTESGLRGMFKRMNMFAKNSINNITQDIKSMGKVTSESVGKVTNSFSDVSQVAQVSSDKVSKSVSKMSDEYGKTEAKISGLRSELAKLVAEQNAIANDFKAYPAFTGKSKQESMQDMLKSNPEYNKLSEQISVLTAKMDPLISKNKELKAEIEKVGSSAQEAGNKLGFKGGSIKKAGKETEKATLKTRVFGNEMKKSGAKSAGFASMINRSFMTIMKRLFVYNLILKGIRGIMNYTGAALKTNRDFVNSLNIVKTNLMVAFQPIYEFILPALNALMRAVAMVTTYIASAISALFGKTYQQSFDAAKGLDDTKKAMAGYGKAAKKAGKEAKGALMGFDEINQLDVKDNDDSDSGGGAGDFEMTMPDTSTIDLSGLEKFKEIIGSMFEPFKKAWENEGKATVDAAKYALSSMLGLMGAIGKSWLEVWTNGTGQSMLENILKIIQNIFNIVGNLATAFKNAWNENEVGTRIVQGIFDMFGIILEIIREITASTAEWAKTLDFSPLLESISTLLGALKPLTQNIGDGLVWLWENALLPIASWVIEDAVPVFLEILAESINALNAVIEALKPLGKWLFDNFLRPVAEWTGGVIISVLGGIRDSLKGIGDWINDNQGTVETLAIIVGSFAAAWGLVNGAITIWNVVAPIATGVMSAVSAAGGVMAAAIGAINLPIILIIAAIGSLIAAGVLLYKHWDVVKEYATKTWDGIKNVFSNFENWLSNSFSRSWAFEFGIFGDVINAFFKNAKNIFDGVKQIFQGIITFLTGAFTGNWRKAFQGLADIMKGIASTFVAIMKAPLNGIIGLMNSAISGLNKIKVPDWVPGVGGKGVNIPKIPMLARGGIIDQPTLAMVGERGKEAVMPLENNTGWITDLAGQIAGIIGATGQGGGGDTSIVVKIGEDTIVDKIISAINRQNRINGETVINV